MNKQIKITILSVCLTVSSSVYPLATELTAGSNLIENTASLAENVEQVAQLARRLRQAQSNLNMFANGGGLPQGNELIQNLEELADVFTQTNTMVYGMANYNPFTELKFAVDQTVQDVKQHYDNWTQQTYDSIRNTLNSAGLQASQFTNEHTRMETLRKKTNDAEGRNQMIQVGNHIAGDMVNQIQKLRQLMITDLRLKSNLATAAENEEEAKREAILEYRKTTPVPAPSADNPLDSIAN